MNDRVYRFALAAFFTPVLATQDWAAGAVQNFNSPLTLKVYAHYSSDVPDTILGFTPVERGHRIHINPGTFWYVRPQGALSPAKLTRLANDIRHYGIPGLDLSDHWEISDESLNHLRHLPSLRLLDLSRTRLTDESAASLATLSGLAILMLPESFHDKGLSALSEVSHLRDLSLDRTKISDAGLRKIARLTRLENLDLSGTMITNRGLEVLRQLPHLKRLVLGGQISDDGAATIAHLTTLQHIDISQTQITDRGLAALATLPHLESVYLNRSIGDLGLKKLSSSVSLKSLDLSGSATTDAGMISVAQIKSLQELDVSQTAITDAGVMALATLPKLRMLELSDTHVTYAGVSALSKVPHLDILSLSWQTLTRQDLQSMSRLPQVKTMILNGVPLTSSTMAQLRRLNHASPWDHISGMQHAELAQTPAVSDQVMTATVAPHHKPSPTQTMASLQGLTEQPLSTPLARGVSDLPQSPEPVAQKKGFWSRHFKTIFVKSPAPASSDTLQAPETPDKVADLKRASSPSGTFDRLQSASPKGGVAVAQTPSRATVDDIAGGSAPLTATAPAAKSSEDNLLQTITLQSDPSQHGGFAGLSGMKQVGLEGSDALNTVTVARQSPIDTQPDKPENSLGEIQVDAR